MTETRFLRADAGPAVPGLSGVLLLGAAQASAQTQLLATAGTEYHWAVEEAAQTIVTGDWSVTLRIETGGPNQASPSVRVRTRIIGSDGAVKATVVDDTLSLSNGTIQDYTWSISSAPSRELAEDDRIVVTVNRTNSTNRTATLRFAGASPDDSRLVHPVGEPIGEPDPSEGDVFLAAYGTDPAGVAHVFGIELELPPQGVVPPSESDMLVPVETIESEDMQSTEATLHEAVAEGAGWIVTGDEPVGATALFRLTESAKRDLAETNNFRYMPYKVGPGQINWTIELGYGTAFTPIADWVEVDVPPEESAVIVTRNPAPVPDEAWTDEGGIRVRVTADVVT